MNPRLVQVDVEEDEESLVSQTTFETRKSAKSVNKIHKKNARQGVRKISFCVGRCYYNKRKIPMEEDGKHVCQSLRDIKDKRSKELVKDWVEHHGGRPRFSAVKKVWRFFPTFGRHKGLHLVRTLAYAAEEPKEEREEENRKIFLDQSAFD